jgi:sortase A
MIGCGCLIAVAITLTRAASFQRAAAQTLERTLVSESDAAPATPIEGGLIGRLEIPRLNLSVIVVEGDDDATLARAVGHVPGTAFPWDVGNAVFAGHRDTFFRPLKDLRDGDELRLTTVRGTFNYRAIRTQIVQPDNRSVLAPTPERSLTLVTCYPFVYIGHAPQRFIVYAQPSH